MEITTPVVASPATDVDAVVRKDVHVYATIRFKVAGVTGNDAQCMEKARQALDISSLVDRTYASEDDLQPDERRVIYAANAEEITAFLVDHLNSEGDYVEEAAYDGDGQPLNRVNNADQLLSVGDYVEVTNDYGVYWGIRRIVGTDVDKFGAMYYLWPSQAPWMHWRASNLRHVLGPTPRTSPAPNLRISLDWGVLGWTRVQPIANGTPPRMSPSERVTADVWADYTSDFHTYSAEPRPDLMLVRLRTSSTVIGMVRYLPDGKKRYIIRRGAHACHPNDLRHFGPVRNAGKRRR